MSAATLASLYPQHLDTLLARATEALSRGGFDHLVVPSGTLHYQAFDDRDYPYAVNPQFKAWLPVTRAPGSWLARLAAIITSSKRLSTTSRQSSTVIRAISVLRPRGR